jgi:hypothetical protein
LKLNSGQVPERPSPASDNRGPVDRSGSGPQGGRPEEIEEVRVHFSMPRRLIPELFCIDTAVSIPIHVLQTSA